MRFHRRRCFHTHIIRVRFALLNASRLCRMSMSFLRRTVRAVMLLAAMMRRDVMLPSGVVVLNLNLIGGAVLLNECSNVSTVRFAASRLMRCIVRCDHLRIA
jgi:hypothetical protein